MRKKIQRQGGMEAYQWLSSKSIRTWVDDDKRCKTRKNFFRNKATKRQQKRNIVSNASFKWSRLFWRASISWKEKITTLMLVFNDINNRIYYRKPRSEMGVTCSGRQKQRGKSIPAYYDWGEPCSRKSNADFTRKVDIHASCQNATQQNGVSMIGVTG